MRTASPVRLSVIAAASALIALVAASVLLAGEAAPKPLAALAAPASRSAALAATETTSQAPAEVQERQPPRPERPSRPADVRPTAGLPVMPVPMSTPPVPDGPAAVLVRSTGSLGAQVVAAASAVPGVAGSSLVRAGEARLSGVRDASGQLLDAVPPGFALPIDVLGIDAASYPALLPPPATAPFAALAPGHALLGATSARVRRADAGAVLMFGARELVVDAVVDDALVGGAEVIVLAADAAALGVDTTPFLLLGTGGDPAALREAAAAALAATRGVLVTDLGHPPWQVSWREPLPLAIVKERFGEFAVRDAAGRAVVQDPAWVEANLVTAAVPLLGEVRCHRAVVPALRAAMTELEGAGLGDLVDAADYAGCASARRTGAGGPVSRHAWGLAVDLNASANPFGAPSVQDPRLVEVMQRHGFGFGGSWPVPDAMHFEYRGEPQATRPTSDSN